MVGTSLGFEGCTACCQPLTGSQPAARSRCPRSSVHGRIIKASGCQAISQALMRDRPQPGEVSMRRTVAALCQGQALGTPGSS